MERRWLNLFLGGGDLRPQKYTWLCPSLPSVLISKLRKGEERNLTGEGFKGRDLREGFLSPSRNVCFGKVLNTKWWEYFHQLKV